MCYKLHTHILEGCTNSLTKVYNCDIYSFVFMSKNISCVVNWNGSTVSVTRLCTYVYLSSQNGGLTCKVVAC